MNKIRKYVTCFILIIILLLAGCTKKDSKNQDTQAQSSPKKEDTTQNDSKLKETAKNKYKEDNCEYFSDGMEIANTDSLLFVDTESVDGLMEKSEWAVEGFVTRSEPYAYEDETGEFTAFTKVTFFVENACEGNSSLEGKEIILLDHSGVRVSGIELHNAHNHYLLCYLRYNV